MRGGEPELGSSGEPGKMGTGRWACVARRGSALTQQEQERGTRIILQECLLFNKAYLKPGLNGILTSRIKGYMMFGNETKKRCALWLMCNLQFKSFCNLPDLDAGWRG